MKNAHVEKFPTHSTMVVSRSIINMQIKINGNSMAPFILQSAVFSRNTFNQKTYFFLSFLTFDKIFLQKDFTFIMKFSKPIENFNQYAFEGEYADGDTIAFLRPKNNMISGI